MTRYIIRRLFLLVFVLFGVSLMTFGISHLMPADPARYAAGLDATAQQIEEARRELGLDQPVPIQYFRYVTGLLQGDMGRSIITRRPVLDDLRDFLPATLELVVTAYLLTAIFGITAGVISATRQGTWSDFATRIPVIAGTGLPDFWLGLMGQLVLYFHWGILPFGGRVDVTSTQVASITGLFLVDSLLMGDLELFRSSLHHLIMPATVLAIGRMTIITRMTRASILEVMGEDYIRTARAKGLSSTRVLFRHALRPAFVPILTELGMQFGWMLAGTIVVESIFSWPGLGQYAFSAIRQHDLPAVMGVTLALTLFKASSNLVVDVLYVFTDPRIRY